MINYKTSVKSIVADYNNGCWGCYPDEQRQAENEGMIDYLTYVFRKHYEDSDDYDPNIFSEFNRAYEDAFDYVIHELDIVNCDFF